MALQAANQFGDKRAGTRWIAARHVGNHDDLTGRIVLGAVLQFIDPKIGQIALLLGICHFNADAAQVLDQRQAQHPRKRPQFAERQLSHALIGGEKTGERGDVPESVAVADDFGGDVINARAKMRCAQ